ncbi:ribosomal protein S3AE [Aciduliprofundum sp. MAR08-339]|uniref:30S ribosomal protein S3ae n=1 Tax=Aciduliprofundum sp. (strain MAR08-339) TaxID=673860 RepID=UPI0002A48EA0|nr:ribosomal protein S3AE [Aciduliprofundum sp. MAR08-339]
MASRRAERAAARRIRDKWRSKVWYTIIAPETFSSKEIGMTPANDPEKVIGRIAESTLYDLTGDFKKMHVKLYFKINRIQGTNAYTRFIGHDMTNDYIRRMVRRRRSRIDAIFPVLTADGYKIRVKVIAVPDRRIKSSIKSELRKKISEYLFAKATELTFSEYVKYLLSDEVKRDLSKALKPIYPVRRIEVRKTEVLHFPEEKVIELEREEEKKEIEVEAPEEVSEEVAEEEVS